MAVGVNKPRTEYSRVELNPCSAIKHRAVLLYLQNLACGAIYRKQRVLIKPLWCQQVVRGYLSD